MSKLIISKFARLSSSQATNLLKLEHLNFTNPQATNGHFRLRQQHRSLMAQSDIANVGSTGFIPSRNFSATSSGSGSNKSDDSKNKNQESSYFDKETVQAKDNKKVSIEKPSLLTSSNPPNNTEAMDEYLYFDYWKNPQEAKPHQTLKMEEKAATPETPEGSDKVSSASLRNLKGKISALKDKVKMSTSKSKEIVQKGTKEEKKPEVQDAGVKNSTNEPTAASIELARKGKSKSKSSVQDKTKPKRPATDGSGGKKSQTVVSRSGSSKITPAAVSAVAHASKSSGSGQVPSKKSSKKRDKYRMEELSKEDCHRRLMFSTKLLLIIEDEPEILDNILWTDECNFNLPKLNPGIIKKPAVSESEQLPQIAWCGITTKGTVGPYFFNSHVTDKSYLKMLESYVIPELQSKGYNLSELWFQQDGAPWHRSKMVLDFLKSVFDYRVISLGTKFMWPPRSQDLTPMDYFFWDYMKLKINFKHSKNDLQFQKGFRDILSKEVITASRKALQGAIYQIPERLEMCLYSNGGRFQHLVEDGNNKISSKKELEGKMSAGESDEFKKILNAMSSVPPSRFNISPSSPAEAKVKSATGNKESPTVPSVPQKSNKPEIAKPAQFFAKESVPGVHNPLKPELNPTLPKPIPTSPPPPSPSKPKTAPIRVESQNKDSSTPSAPKPQPGRVPSGPGQAQPKPTTTTAAAAPVAPPKRSAGSLSLTSPPGPVQQKPSVSTPPVESPSGTKQTKPTAQVTFKPPLPQAKPSIPSAPPKQPSHTTQPNIPSVATATPPKPSERGSSPKVAPRPSDRASSPKVSLKSRPIKPSPPAVPSLVGTVLPKSSTTVQPPSTKPQAGASTTTTPKPSVREQRPPALTKAIRPAGSAPPQSQPKRRPSAAPPKSSPTSINVQPPKHAQSTGQSKPPPAAATPDPKAAPPPPPIQMPNAKQLDLRKKSAGAVGERKAVAQNKAPAPPPPPPTPSHSQPELKTCVNTVIAEAAISNSLSEDLFNHNYSFGKKKDKETE